MLLPPPLPLASLTLPGTQPGSSPTQQANATAKQPTAAVMPTS